MLDPLQYALKGSVDDEVALARSTTLKHLDTNNTCACMLFPHYSAVFNMIWPTKVVDLGMPIPTCKMHFRLFLFYPHQQWSVCRNKASAELPVGTGTHLSCCLRPKVYALNTYGCLSNQGDKIIKYADGTTFLGLHTSYRELVHKIIVYREDNDLVLKIDQTKEVILYFRSRIHLYNLLPSRGLRWSRLTVIR